MARELLRANELGGKTGTCVRIDGSVGWFVGHAKQGATDYVFVTLIRSRAKAFAPGGASGPRAREISRELLRAAKVL